MKAILSEIREFQDDPRCVSAACAEPDWRNDATGYSYEISDVSNLGSASDEDEPPEDLRERWELHSVADPETPRKPCGSERGSANAANCLGRKTEAL